MGPFGNAVPGHHAADTAKVHVAARTDIEVGGGNTPGEPTKILALVNDLSELANDETVENGQDDNGAKPDRYVAE